MPRVVVGSKSPEKINAVREAFTNDRNPGPVIEGVPSASHVSEQPMGPSETIRGARNRLDDAKRLAPGADFYVGIENGIMEVDGDYFDVGWVIVEAISLGRTTMTCSQGVQIPASVVQEVIRVGVNQTHCGRVLAARSGCNPNAPHAFLTANRTSRQEILRNAIRVALGQLEAPTVTSPPC
ncbi:putative inosine/xanthosine triphosphatase [Paratrimastix pyriformis]|uniref:inosine/xanthosine triphosphatase n=1 Tax=Paratrimastix pyriformis TaxID=342808 RepID=A0ABQ8UHY1_9EUKA|nr:putative inosine/xanthosine triphosphatase [Paratrimastix pyriformis]